MRVFFLGVISILALLALTTTAIAQDAEATTYQNPIIEANFPDPFVLQVADTYYAYSTNSNNRNVPVARSNDLVTWEILPRDSMPSLASWVRLSRPDVWAPEVLQVEDQYILYYTAHDQTSDRQCIGLAIAPSPEGPFRDSNDTPFICQAREGGSIDASPFRDEDGTLYLLWKNDGNCCSIPTYIYGQQLAPDGLSLVGEPVQLARNDATWEGPIIEAPTMWHQDESYYLFFTANEYWTEKYAVGYATCETPLGPCEDAEENPILISEMASQPLVVGPGHQTIITDANGDTWLFYHTWQVVGGRRSDNRQVRLDRLVWENGRPVVLGPTRDEQPLPITGHD